MLRFLQLVGGLAIIGAVVWLIVSLLRHIDRPPERPRGRNDSGNANVAVTCIQ